MTATAVRSAVIPTRGVIGESPAFAAGRLAGHERFAACVAHELRAPIALQRALVEVALADPHTDTAALRAMGERVIASCVRQQRLIEAVLDLARGRSGVRRHEPVDIASITSRALRAHDLSQFESVVALAPAPTTGDPDLLERILQPHLQRDPPQRDRRSSRSRDRTDSGHAVLTVTNAGRLISAEELGRLFQPFERLGPQPRAGIDGVGLGLTIVQAIADAHDATVAARARAGGGLTVVVSFRRPRPQAAHTCQR